MFTQLFLPLFVLALVNIFYLKNKWVTIGIELAFIIISSVDIIFGIFHLVPFLNVFNIIYSTYFLTKKYKDGVLSESTPDEPNVEIDFPLEDKICNRIKSDEVSVDYKSNDQKESYSLWITGDKYMVFLDRVTNHYGVKIDGISFNDHINAEYLFTLVADYFNGEEKNQIEKIKNHIRKF